MKLKLLFILVLYWATIIFMAMFQSCGLLSFDATICDIEFRGLERYPIVQQDTMTTDVSFAVIAYPGEIGSIGPTFNLVSTCYATTKCARWQNRILESTFKMSFDRQVIIAGDTILPDTDLFQLPAFTNGIQILENDRHCKSIDYAIVFGSELLNQISFENGMYTVSFSCSTDDNRTFLKQRQVVFKL
jgi:hypothetical protein